MECLIEHKFELDSRTDNKCKAAITHFQLISLKNYRFTFKFKEACRPYVMRYCPQYVHNYNIFFKSLLFILGKFNY